MAQTTTVVVLKESPAGSCCQFDTMEKKLVNARLFLDAACYIWLWIAFSTIPSIGTALFILLHFSLFAWVNILPLIFTSAEVCCDGFMCSCCCKGCCETKKAKTVGTVVLVIIRIIAISKVFEMIAAVKDIQETFSSLDFGDEDVDKMFDGFLAMMWIEAIIQFTALAALVFWWFTIIYKDAETTAISVPVATTEASAGGGQVAMVEKQPSA